MFTSRPPPAGLFQQLPRALLVLCQRQVAGHLLVETLEVSKAFWRAVPAAPGRTAGR
jgi:hypothetical protein